MNAYMLTVSPADVVHAAVLGQGHHRRTHVGAQGAYPTWNPHPGSQEMAGGVSSGDVQQLEAQVAAQMAATGAGVRGCPSMSPSDIAAWEGIVESWQSFDSVLKPCVENLPADNQTPPDLSCMLALGYSWSATMTKLQSFQAQAAAYQVRVKQACPSWQAPPTPTPGGGTCGWWDSMLGRCQPTDQSTSWPTAIKWVALAGVVLVSLWYVGPLVGALAGAAATHVGGRPKELES